MWNLQFELIPTLFSIFAWGVILVIAHFLYIKQEINPTRWKAFIVLFIGVFSFSFSWLMDSTVMRFPILPLGVWIVYAALKNKEAKWPAYRRFAWLGFWSNFLFLATSLLSVYGQDLVYPPDQPSTYLADVTEASVVPSHPSAKEVALRDEALEDLSKWNQKAVNSVQWYKEGDLWEDPNKRDERFPYLLKDADSKWGSGADSQVYIEEDGKGLLITTMQEQYYYRTEQSVLVGELDE
ncbi:hypothetical protein H0266_16930 [Halobacillus locisalis]|uniref:Uncharacterized protein n=1 Tax=Halobacillus locisalis TaxID=220753 RepID=A0A838CXC7_9BACI|nr:hypothetical protein [Halobacillus locisalis]MBA2176574.1 hypothetical protein [Halobacillus locisalis]